MRTVNLVILFLLLFTTASMAQTAFEEGVMLKNTLNGKVQLYPNPATEYLHVRLDNIEISNLKLSVRNIIGNIVPVEIEYLGDSELRVRVKDFAIGYYLLAMQEEKSNFKGTYKFLKR